MWDPFRDLERFLGHANSFGRPFYFGTSTVGSWMPAMDLIEKPECYKILADVPGMRREDITVDIEGNRLCIGGNRKSLLKEDEQNHALVLERPNGRFQRCVQLPHTIAEKSVKASLNDAVLVVEIKRDNAKKDVTSTAVTIQ